MFSLDTIFISLTFLILSGLLIKIRSSKAIIPLVLIYIFFLFDKLSTEKVKIDPIVDDKKAEIKSMQPLDNVEVDKLSKNNQVPILTNKDEGREQKIIASKKELDKKSINKKEKEIKLKKEKNTKIKSNEPKKVSKVKEKKQTFNNLVKLKEIKICKNIKNRSPVGVGEIFPSSVDSLYCYTKIENLGKKMEVRHVWYYENQIMTQVRYNVKKSNVYRSWTKKTISSFQIGNWRVEVQDRNGTIIGTKQFKIKKSS
tara:strand:- start:1926 stop:2693 length:768 start_codon:yes stop_codon:yes gene_type:complete